MRISISDKELLSEFEALLEKHRAQLEKMGNDDIKQVIVMCARNGIPEVDRILKICEDFDKPPKKQSA